MMPVTKLSHFGAGYESITLVVLTVISWLAFFLVVIITGVYGEGACLHDLWLPQDGPAPSPYWSFVALVIALLLFALTLSVRAVATRNRVNAVIGFVAIVVLVAWLYGLHGLWRAMLYEQGALSAEEWYSARAPGYSALTGLSLRPCDMPPNK
jgi:hypothetical protein